MPDFDDMINLYLGWGTESYPKPDYSRVLSVYPAAAPNTLLMLKTIVDQVDNFDVDWTRMDDAFAEHALRDFLREQAPDLTPGAIEALVWRFTWIWK